MSRMEVFDIYWKHKGDDDKLFHDSGKISAVNGYFHIGDKFELNLGEMCKIEAGGRRKLLIFLNKFVHF